MAPLETPYRKEVILGWTPLRFAEETEAWESVEMLLNGGCSTRDLDITKWKLKIALQAPSVVSKMCRRGCLKLLRFALSENPDVLLFPLERSYTLLHVAAEAGCSVSVRCLLDYPLDVNATDGRGVTPLHLAAAHCDPHVLGLLIRAGADAQARDSAGRSALHHAASGGSAANIRFLLAEGLAPDLKSAEGCSPLHEAASSSNHHCVQLLLSAGAGLHVTTRLGWTALHWAASRGTLRSVQLLLQAGIQAGVTTLEDETPLHLAAERGHPDVEALLVAHGADVGALDSSRRTPARRAADRLQKQLEQAAAAAPMYSDDTDDSDSSYQYELELRRQSYFDSGSDSKEEHYSTASGGTAARDVLASFISVEMDTEQCDGQVCGHSQRDERCGRGGGNFNGHKSCSRDGGHSQSEEGEQVYPRVNTQSPETAQHTGNVQQREQSHHRRRRRRRRKAKGAEAKTEGETQRNSGDTRRKERLHNTPRVDRQKHTSDETNVPQTMPLDSGAQQGPEDSGSADQKGVVAALS